MSTTNHAGFSGRTQARNLTAVARAHYYAAHAQRHLPAPRTLADLFEANDLADLHAERRRADSAAQRLLVSMAVLLLAAVLLSCAPKALPLSNREPAQPRTATVR